MNEFSLSDINGMRRIGIRELGRTPAELFDRLDDDGPALITRNGRPVAILSPITEPAFRRKRALEPMTGDELARLIERPPPKNEEPLPDIELNEIERTVLAEIIVWFGGRAWIINDDDESRLTAQQMFRTLGRLESVRLTTRRGAGDVPTRLGARYAREKFGREFIEKAGRACYYGFPPERLGYRPRGEEIGIRVP